MAPSSGTPSFKELRASLLEDRTLTGIQWCHKYCQIADGWLGQVFEEAVGSDPRGFALLAVGGYGRGSLAPGSDLDLLLVHDGSRPARSGSRRQVKDVAEAIWYPVWDAGMHLDHSVRTPKEVRAAMDSDIKVALGLLDGRSVVGDDELANQVLTKATEMWRTRAAKWLPILDQVTKDRHQRFGDLAFLLEPDLKEARGGTRDLQLLRSLGQVVPVLSSVAGDRNLERAEDLLFSVRVELQRPTAQAGNFLLLQDQDMVASVLDFADADALMAAVADAARTIAWTNDDGWRRIESWLAGPKGRGGGGDRVLEPGIVLRDGEIALRSGADPAVDQSLALRLAALSAELDRPLSRHTLDRLTARAMAPDEVWPPAVLQGFLRLLGAGHATIPAVEALDQQGVWVRYLPEWSYVRNRPQRNAYHRFTVDRHLLETVANAAGMQSSVARPDMLLLGALLHDIGKGRGGDHTEIGIAVVGQLGPRLGLPAEDVTTLQNLVRHHLLLPDVATRRDLDDPATTAAVAAAVGDRTTLELLTALTEADSKATGPAAWGTWKAGLIRRLVDQVRGALEGRPPPGPEPLAPEQLALLSAGRLEVHAEGGTLTVAAPDRPGLLSITAGVLALSGVNVRSANTLSDQASGMALLRFDVAPAFDELPDWFTFKRDLRAALDGGADIDLLLAKREAEYARFRRSTQAYQPEPRVLFDHQASSTSTVIEVRALDRGPFLYQVTKALTDCQVTIVSALVSTLGAEAIDVFYVQSLKGGRVTDPAHLQKLEEAVLAAL